MFPIISEHYLTDPVVEQISLKLMRIKAILQLLDKQTSFAKEKTFDNYKNLLFAEIDLLFYYLNGILGNPFNDETEDQFQESLVNPKGSAVLIQARIVLLELREVSRLVKDVRGVADNNDIPNVDLKFVYSFNLTNFTLTQIGLIYQMLQSIFTLNFCV